MCTKKLHFGVGQTYGESSPLAHKLNLISGHIFLTCLNTQFIIDFPYRPLIHWNLHPWRTLFPTSKSTHSSSLPQIWQHWFLSGGSPWRLRVSSCWKIHKFNIISQTRKDKFLSQKYVLKTENHLASLRFSFSGMLSKFSLIVLVDAYEVILKHIGNLFVTKRSAETKIKFWSAILQSYSKICYYHFLTFDYSEYE